MSVHQWNVEYDNLVLYQCAIDTPLINRYPFFRLVLFFCSTLFCFSYLRISRFFLDVALIRSKRYILPYFVNLIFCFITIVFHHSADEKYALTYQPFPDLLYRNRQQYLRRTKNMRKPFSNTVYQLNISKKVKWKHFLHTSFYSRFV